MKKKIDWKIVCTGLVCLTLIELYALNLGYNGTMLKIFIAIIAISIGVFIPKDILIKILKGGN